MRENEREHLMKCGECQQPFDMRNLDEVFWHETHTLPKPEPTGIVGVRIEKEPTK